MRYAEWKSRFAKRLDALKAEAVEAVKKAVAEDCDSEQWELRIGFRGPHVTTSDGRGELDPVTSVHKILGWYEEEFGPFPRLEYRNGRWISHEEKS